MSKHKDRERILEEGRSVGDRFGRSEQLRFHCPHCAVEGIDKVLMDRHIARCGNKEQLV